MLKLMVDGSPAGSASGVGIANINNSNDFRIGRSLVDASVSRFAPAASFDEFYVFESALAEHEVHAIYSQNASGMRTLQLRSM